MVVLAAQEKMKNLYDRNIENEAPVFHNKGTKYDKGVALRC